MTMDNIVAFPGANPASIGGRAPAIERKNMQTFLFRSRELILESDETDLVRDVCLNIDRAQTKLKAIRRRLQGLQEYTAEQLHLLTTADTKLTAAIAAAHSRHMGNDETPALIAPKAQPAEAGGSYKAAKAAQVATSPPADCAFIGKAKPDLWSEVGAIRVDLTAVLSKLDVKGLLPHAVKCLGVFLERSNVAAALALQRQGRPKRPAMSADEFQGALASLSEMDRQYFHGYIQGMIDARVLR